MTTTRSNSSTRLVSEGVTAGLIGAAVVAGWFLMLDAAQGHIFRTPALLGAVLLHGLRDVQALVLTRGLVFEHTAIHVAAFGTFGLVAAGLLALADREPVMLVALFMFFCCFEVFAFALIAVLAEWLLEAVPMWSILGANLLAMVSMLGVLLPRHRVTWQVFVSTAE